MNGFVKDFAYTLGWQSQEGTWSIVPGTTASDIMGCFTPEALPVLSALARGYAVCDHWFSSAPTETLPNRAFACAATSQGHMDDKTHTFTAPSIFGLLDSHELSWAIYGYDPQPLTKDTFTDITGARPEPFRAVHRLHRGGGAGRCPRSPSWSPAGARPATASTRTTTSPSASSSSTTCTRRCATVPAGPQTLLVITYDEHGGCYDHVPPPSGATPPDDDAGEFGFDFTRFGVRVPTVLVSPLIAPGTVFRVPAGSTPLDHTSILKTVEQRWGLPSLTARDAAAPGFGDVLTLTAPRTDDVLAGVTVPVPAPRARPRRSRRTCRKSRPSWSPASSRPDVTPGDRRHGPGQHAALASYIRAHA